jgi:hypothetical protein
MLDGKRVNAINSYLKSGGERANAQPLFANDGLSFLGCKIGGQGFIVSPDEVPRLKLSKSEAELVKPYLGGEEVNTSPRQEYERYVIDFGQRVLEDVESRFPTLIDIVRKNVKPYRDTVRRDTWRKRWWQFAEVYPSMRAAIAPLERCLVTGCVSKHLMFSFQPRGRVFSHKLYVFPFDGFVPFAVLQSRVHVSWAWLLSSTMKTDLNYSASDCFETFPFPKPDPRSVIPELERAGETLYEARAKFMVDTNQGLTKTYNALKDPACEDPRILELRRLHEAMDRAVLDAYGWSDVVVPPYCPLNDADKAQIAAFEDESIDRLYVLNAERAAEEQRLGLGGKSSAKRRSSDDDEPSSDESSGEVAKPSGKTTTRPGASSGKGAKKAVASANVKGRNSDEATKGSPKKPKGAKTDPEGQGSLF